MVIKEDYSYISENQKMLIKNGYGEISIDSLDFDRYYTEEEKKENRKRAESMNNKEYNVFCDNVLKDFDKQFKIIKYVFKQSKYNIHQISDETSTLEHYKSDWDLYFYSNEGCNQTEYMDRINLAFNKKRKVEDNKKLLKDLLQLIKIMKFKNISCRVQYVFVPNKEKMDIEYNSICKKLAGKFIEYKGMIGKIKAVENGYGFFKKGSKKRYYELLAEDIIVYDIVNN